jgi:hypothetical protein
MGELNPSDTVWWTRRLCETDTRRMTDTETADLIRLLDRLAVRALVLAAVCVPAGYTTVAVALGLVGCGLLFAPVGRGRITPANAPATPAPPGSTAPDRGPRGGSPG